MKNNFWKKIDWKKFFTVELVALWILIVLGILSPEHLKSLKQVYAIIAVLILLGFIMLGKVFETYLLTKSKKDEKK